MKHTYDVWSYDVWGNEEDGFEVNDRSKIGTIDLSDADVDVDRQLINQLIKNGFLKENANVSDFAIDGCQYTLYVNVEANGYPLYELVRQD